MEYYKFEYYVLWLFLCADAQHLIKKLAKSKELTIYKYMSLNILSYSRVWEWWDSIVYRRGNSGTALKVYEPHIFRNTIECYHWLHKWYATHKPTPFRPWENTSQLFESDREILFRWKTVAWLVCKILALNSHEVYFGYVNIYGSPRVISRVQFIEWVTLKWEWVVHADPLIKEIERRLRHTGIPIWEWLWAFKISPVNVKVISFREGILEVLITDLGSNIPISMAWKIDKFWRPIP